jgi:arginyl-tRNA synthetase
MTDPLLELRSAVEDSVAALRDGEATDARPTLERPPRPELGDYSTNAAMLLAPLRGEPPRDVAERLRE